MAAFACWHLPYYFISLKDEKILLIFAGGKNKYIFCFRPVTFHIDSCGKFSPLFDFFHSEYCGKVCE